MWHNILHTPYPTFLSHDLQRRFLVFINACSSINLVDRRIGWAQELERQHRQCFEDAHGSKVYVVVGQFHTVIRMVDGPVLVRYIFVFRENNWVAQIVHTETRRDKRLVYVASHALLIEIRVHVRLDLPCVLLCEARPVHSGMHMVDGVVAIIESEKVHDRTHKVASSVVVLHLHTAILIYIHITAVMLQHIHGHDSPLCKKVREPYIEQKLAPVQDKHSNLCHPHHKPFLTALSIKAFALQAFQGKVTHVHFEYVPRYCGLKHDAIHHVPLVPQL
mmetsp:Transcript_90659/g.132609  ORF Transcript_90659/g.132609 Transcript_90659/m.132609 type:complete len:276 (-) Transcript_90659:489-1316(-)